MSNKVYTDRTRTVAYQRCHRLGWLTTYENGKGIQRKSLNPHLLVGTYVHVGGNELLDGRPIETAIENVRAKWDAEVADKQVEECLSEYQRVMLNDCWNLVEGQVRAFELVMLPKMLDEYEVLDTEKEECYLLDSGNGVWNFGQRGGIEVVPDIMWMARLDATLRHKVTGDIGPLSIKTTGRWDKRKEDAARHDMQGCSEMWTLQQRGIEAKAADPRFVDENVQFVQMLYILKGSKKEDPASGQWQFWSPLTKGYRRLSNEGEEWAHSYWWTCKEMHVKGYNKKGEALYCKGQEKHNCQGWEAVDIASTYQGGIRAWIEALQDGSIQPLAAESEQILQGQFIFPAPIYRGQQEIDRWKRATVAEKRRIIGHAEEVIAANAEWDDKKKEELLDQYFPMYTHSCDYPSRCSMQDICHGGVDPLESGLYEPRKANHPIEEEEL